EVDGRAAAGALGRRWPERHRGDAAPVDAPLSHGARVAAAAAVAVVGLRVDAGLVARGQGGHAAGRARVARADLRPRAHDAAAAAVVRVARRDARAVAVALVNGARVRAIPSVPGLAVAGRPPVAEDAGVTAPEEVAAVASLAVVVLAAG